ncbi:hypothetical protein [Actinoplanes solisilvae]|uniref:hypothetical protein n=1 Tax=Actinoplanes solisilvae TaxID=2486853 RepID=UPI000FDCBBBE|nr:hypothetical protein [Actinoplanes solisilvae]
MKLLAAVVAAAILSIAGATPAAAADKFGCKYPRVCLYLKKADWGARKPTAAYQIKTQDFQTLGPRARHAYAVYNSRRDDAVLLLLPGRGRDGGDNQICVGPRKSKVLGATSKIRGVLIVDEARCDRVR